MIFQEAVSNGVPAMAHHLTPEEREVAAQMRSAGRKQVEIAQRLDRAASTISRELRRNRSRNGVESLLRQTLLRLAAWQEREYQQPDEP